MIFAGGIPLQRGEEILGAFGVSGDTGDQHQAVVEAAVAGLSTPRGRQEARAAFLEGPGRALGRRVGQALGPSTGVVFREPAIEKLDVIADNPERRLAQPDASG